MGRQDGVVLIKGGVGNLSFYKSQDGYLVRKKSGVPRHRIMSDEAYARTRENIAEFARGARATKLIRSAFASLIGDVADNRVTSRLTSTVMKIIKSDPINPHGQRNVTKGDVSLLRGFKFNKNADLAMGFSGLFTASIERVTGTMTVDIPAFDPAKLIRAPEGATHFRFRTAGAAIDFTHGTFSAATSQSSDIPLNEEMRNPLRLSHTVGINSANPLFLTLAIEFLQCINGKQKALADKMLNAMTLVKVDASYPAQLTDKQVSEKSSITPVRSKHPVPDKFPAHEQQNNDPSTANPFYDEQSLRRSLLIHFDVRQVDARHQLLSQLGLSGPTFMAKGDQPADSNPGYADDVAPHLDIFPAIFKVRDG